MGIRDFFLKFNKKSHSLGKQRNQEVLDFFRMGIDRNITDHESYELYNTNPAVSDAVGTIAQKASTIKPIIKDKEGEINTDHEVLTFLKKPNKLQNYSEFMEDITSNYIIQTNSFIEAIGESRTKVKQMYSLRNTWVSITEQVGKAEYLVTNSDFYNFLSGNFFLDHEIGRILERSKQREILHIKGFALSRNSLKAVSAMLSIKADSETVNQAILHNLRLLEEGFNGAGVFNINTEDRDAFDRTCKDIKNKFSGAGNPRNPIVSKGEQVTFTSFGQTNKDMEYSKTRTMSQETIYQRFGIPKPLIDASAQTYNNYQTALYALYDDAVLPLLVRIFANLTLFFQQRNMMTEDEFLSFDESSIPALQLRRNQELEVLTKSFVATLNERRSKVGLERSDGSAAKIIFQPQNLVPVASDDFTSDELEVPSKQLFKELEEHGLSKLEIISVWNDYKKTQLQ